MFSVILDVQEYCICPPALKQGLQTIAYISSSLTAEQSQLEVILLL